MKLKNKIIKLIILIILVIITISLVVVFGRYVNKKVNDFFVKSKEFYFNSDKLSENRSSYQIENWDGVDSYTVTINMNSRENNIEKVDYDISYSIEYTASDNITCQLSKSSGIIYASTNSDSFNIIMTPSGQLSVGDSVWVEVTVNSTSNFKKTLKGRFTLIVGKENLSYEVEDEANRPYLELKLTNTISYYTATEAVGSYSYGDKIDGDTYLSLTDTLKSKFKSSVVNISFDPHSVLLDITNSNYSKYTNITTTTIDGSLYVNGFTLDLEALSSENIRFYKADITRDYTYPKDDSSCIITIT